MYEYEVYVVDPVRAALWAGAPVVVGAVVSRATVECTMANCGACGILHGVADAATLEKHGLAVRRA